MSVALWTYRAATRLLEPLAPRLLDGRARRGKEDAARVDERLGAASAARPEGDLVWLHGVSVGETLSLLPLVDRLRRERPDLTVLVTSGTVTSAQLLARRLPAAVIHQYAPVDGPQATAAFLDHWRPTLGVMVESELWPNLLLAAQARGVKLALVSARITQKTADGWARFPAAARKVLAAFDRVLPQDDASAERLAALGARVDGRANLKLAGEAPPHDPAAFTAMSAAVGDRPVIVAASTHEGEEAAIVRTLDRLTGRVCLILVPRHPERGPGVAAALEAEGWRLAVRSRGQRLDGGTDLYLADTLGEMGLFLRLADVVVMGGSFHAAVGQPPVGGHNPLEPARLGKPAFTGPDMTNWAAVTEMLTAGGGLRVVETPDALPEAIGPLLTDPAAAKRMGEAGRRTATEVGAVVDQVTAALGPLLPARTKR
ncbi:3-deoxy-D-manno-octulosonic acid transferase [Brevundimonas sp.]|uniref:3-deoxy-D-manno-octulosonic acid transferase n=1 Tax=Brevundimonas sp. TaxID=1871086 RepID=UPI002E110D6E|nr:3-deoxy-D-manno-octulosonic acid transferase [Brevundimonas sp.]